MAYMQLIMEPHGQRAERGLAGGQEAYQAAEILVSCPKIDESEGA